MDGLSVWLRETTRPANEQSPGIIRHETDRAQRLIDVWETEIQRATMQGKLNMAQIALVCALGLDARNRDFRWRDGHPKLCAWFDGMAVRPSIATTAPPQGH
jgi:glutathione S-transferase